MHFCFFFLPISNRKYAFTINRLCLDMKMNSFMLVYHLSCKVFVVVWNTCIWDEDISKLHIGCINELFESFTSLIYSLITNKFRFGFCLELGFGFGFGFRNVISWKERLFIQNLSGERQTYEVKMNNQAKFVNEKTFEFQFNSELW